MAYGMLITGVFFVTIVLSLNYLSDSVSMFLVSLIDISYYILIVGVILTYYVK